MLGDRLAVLMAFLCVSDRLDQAILDHADATGRHAEPAADQRRHRNAESVALLAQQVVGRDGMVHQLEHGRVRGRQAELGGQVLAVETGPAGIDDERADAIPLSFGIGEGDDRLGDAAVGNQIFHAVE